MPPPTAAEIARNIYFATKMARNALNTVDSQPRKARIEIDVVSLEVLDELDRLLREENLLKTMRVGPTAYEDEVISQVVCFTAGVTFLCRIPVKTDK